MSQPLDAVSPGRRALRVAGVALVTIVALGLLVYVLGYMYFSQHLWPRASAEEVDLSLMTVPEATQAINDAYLNRSMHVSGQGVDFKLSAGDGWIEPISPAVMDDILKESRTFAWPTRALQAQDFSAQVQTSFDRDAILVAVTSALAPYNAAAIDPVDATIGYSVDMGRYVVFPGSLGTKLDPEAVTDKVMAALTGDKTFASITSDDLVQQNVTADDPALQAAVERANAYLASNFNLTMAGVPVRTVNADLIKDWVTIGGDLSVNVNYEAITAWVDALEAEVDDVGSTRSYTRPDGKWITVSGGDWGWVSDGDATEALIVDCISNGVTGDVELPCKEYAVYYNPGGAEWGARYIDVDITEQHVRFYDWDGSIIWESDCITGSPLVGHDSPQGVYSLNDKALNQVLKGKPDPVTLKPEYETPVAYWMPFVDNAVGFHDATWQPGFGGSLYMSGYGSHGCINLPYYAAESLYSIIAIDDVVVVHY